MEVPKDEAITEAGAIAAAEADEVVVVVAVVADEAGAAVPEPRLSKACLEMMMNTQQ